MRVILVCLLAVAAPALAGPPFVTDDPEPADYRHFEINLAATGTIVKGGVGGDFPNIDINYGLFPDTQLHVGLTAPFQSGGGTRFGYGDTELGVKYRFIEEVEEGWQPQLAIYPNIDFPTGNSAQGLGAGHRKIFLPLWAQKSWGDWQSYGGGGYWLNQSGSGDRNYWFMGWALLCKFSEEWTLGGEIFHQTGDLTRDSVTSGDRLSRRDSTGFNLGGYYNLDEDRHVMFTFGRGLQNIAATNQFSFYVGYQLIF